MTAISERATVPHRALVPSKVTRRRARHLVAQKVCSESIVAPRGPGQPALLLSIFLIAFGFPLGFGLTSALLPCLIFLPRYVREFRNNRFLAFLYIGVVVMVANGILLHVLDQNATDIGVAIFMTTFTVVQIASVGFIVWAKRYVDVTLILISYAIGMLLNATVVTGFSFANVKFALAIPIVLVAGALAGSKWYAPLVFFGIAALGMANGARSFAAFAIAAPLLVLLGRFFVAPGRRKGVGRRVVLTFLCAGVGYALYSIGTSLLLSGVLGEYNRARTVRQLNETGSLIASARPEWFATLNLMKDDWLGRGPGAVPELRDLTTARIGLADGGFLGGGDYVTGYMFGGHYELHSIIADMWVSFGVAGLVVGCAVLLYVLRSTILELTSPAVRPVTVFLLVASTWYLLFGPLTSNLPLVCLTVALCISTDIGIREKRAR